MKFYQKNVFEIGTQRVNNLFSSIVLFIFAISAIGTLSLARNSTFSDQVLAAGTAPVGSLVFVASHPYAIKQPTARGRYLWNMEPYNGKLYVGYGDYDANTGPIKIAPYDPVTNTFILEWTSYTEAIENFRTLGGKLYAPSTDLKKTSVVGQSALYVAGLPWQNFYPFGATHAYDMNTLNGSDLWVVGSKSTSAVAWRSTDGGLTWNVALSLPRKIKGQFERFYFIGSYNGKIYLQAYPDYQTSKVFDGTTWTDGPNLLTWAWGWRPILFAGKMIYSQEDHGSPFYPVITATPTQASGSPSPTGGTPTGGGGPPVDHGSPIFTFDGTTVTQLSNNDVRIFTIDGNYFYGASQAGLVYRTTDLINWESLGGSLPAGEYAASIAILNDTLYMGTNKANIYKLDIPLSSIPSPTPTQVPTNIPTPTP